MTEAAFIFKATLATQQLVLGPGHPETHATALSARHLQELTTDHIDVCKSNQRQTAAAAPPSLALPPFIF